MDGPATDETYARAHSHPQPCAARQHRPFLDDYSAKGLAATPWTLLPGRQPKRLRIRRARRESVSVPCEMRVGWRNQTLQNSGGVCRQPSAGRAEKNEPCTRVGSGRCQIGGRRLRCCRARRVPPGETCVNPRGPSGRTVRQDPVRRKLADRCRSWGMCWVGLGREGLVSLERIHGSTLNVREHGEVVRGVAVCVRSVRVPPPPRPRYRRTRSAAAASPRP